MIVGVPRETYPGERRVALIPSLAKRLMQAEHEVWVESGAGDEAGHPDDAFESQGAQIQSRDEIFQGADIIAQVRGLGANRDAGREDLDRLREGQGLIAMMDPLSEPDSARELSEQGVTSYAMELMPRISRAQSMDALSSQANIGGYKSVLLAADALPKIFPMMMTAAGTITPARAFVVGAGVAGLQAIATARRLGSVVKSYDIRPEVKEQVESLGAKFVELELETDDASGEGGYAQAMDEEFYRKQREMMNEVVAESDVVVTTAAVPGKEAPILVTEEMVQGMAPGSVLVDLAAERGGNCDLTEPGQNVEAHGVTVIGPENLPSSVPKHASQMYASNVVNFLEHLLDHGGLDDPDTEDQIVHDTMLTRDGLVVHETVRELLGDAPAETASASADDAPTDTEGESS